MVWRIRPRSFSKFMALKEVRESCLDLDFLCEDWRGGLDWTGRGGFAGDTGAEVEPCRTGLEGSSSGVGGRTCGAARFYPSIGFHFAVITFVGS